MTVVVALEGVSKSFRTYRNSIDRVASWFGFRRAAVRSHDAVRDVSFRVGEGESVALIGQNGAGKSTLLKLITGTLRPSAGAIHLAGRLSAVLELGLGFHPELTGRQNVLHAGGLLGYSHDELLAIIPIVEEFAELGPFFDQPLRTYSSGMQARLAFSLATARRPDILIIDEVLSVGDSYFQHKSFSRIRQFKDEGTSLLFVSHGMADVRALCDRVVLIDAGSVVKDGPADEVIDYYNALVLAKGNAVNFEQSRGQNGWLSSRSGNRSVDVTSVDLLDASFGEHLSTVNVGQPIEIRLIIHTFLETENLVAGILIRDKHGHVVWGTNTAHLGLIIPSVNRDRDVMISFNLDCRLGPGSYSLSPAAVSWIGDIDTTFDWHDNAVVFDVVNTDQPLFVGSTHLDVEATLSVE